MCDAEDRVNEAEDRVNELEGELTNLELDKCILEERIGELETQLEEVGVSCNGFHMVDPLVDLWECVKCEKHLSVLDHAAVLPGSATGTDQALRNFRSGAQVIT